MEDLQLIQAIALILTISTSVDCGSGTSIFGYDLYNSDSSNTAFIEIIDQDSTSHWYFDLYEGENLCYKHNQYERVVRARR